MKLLESPSHVFPRLVSLVASAFLIHGISVAAQLDDSPMPAKADRFPVLNDAAAVQGAYTNPDSWQGRSISVEGTVKAVIKNQYGRLSFELQLSDSPEVTLWAMFSLPIGNGSEPKIGERLRAAGWVRKTEGWEKMIATTLPRQNPLTLLANCLVSVPSLEAIVDPKFGKFCAGWQRGISLPDMAR